MKTEKEIRKELEMCKAKLEEWSRVYGNKPVHEYPSYYKSLFHSTQALAWVLEVYHDE